MLYLNNAFSLSMLPGDCNITVRCLDIEDVKQMLKNRPYESIVGHSDTARIMEDLLGFPVTPNRKSITLDLSDELIVGQYIGPRLPEGTTTLPEEAYIAWVHVQHLL